jgi:hypothetical protein
MSYDYMRTSLRRARRRRASLAMVLALACTMMVWAGCGRPSSPQPATVEEAYDAAHPPGQGPPSLRTVPLTRRQVARRLTGILGDGSRILLPRSLPPRYAPAAPYISVGEGSARPNPEAWGRSYRVSYTDRRGLLVITFGAVRPPEGVAWSARRLTVDGRPARKGRAGGTVVVATVAGKPRIVVTGLHVGADEVAACAESLVPAR